MRTTLPAAIAAVLIGLGPAALPASAAEDAPPPPPPPPPPACTTDAAPFRDFDYWVGHWDVYAPNGNFAGENLISLRENGCLIIEEWTGAGGGSGTSMNFYDTGMGAWRQIWRSPGAVIDYAGGLDDDGAMFLEGTISYDAGGEPAPFRGKWTLQEDGSVLQEFWQQDTETGEWGSWFVGEYRPKPEDEAEAADAP
ncbi:MAG: hypothetical protein PVI23_13290 [Maricaulaceae bacterium]|jgi:hypothetical protein